MNICEETIAMVNYIKTGKRLLAKPTGLSSAAASRSFTHSSEAVWNKLPEDLRKVDNIKTFKSRLKTFLFTCVHRMKLCRTHPAPTIYFRQLEYEWCVTSASYIHTY